MKKGERDIIVQCQRVERGMEVGQAKSERENNI